jgi:hypothetical protein
MFSMSTKEMKKNPETKGGAGPTSNASFDSERGYGTSEQKERIKQQASKYENTSLFLPTFYG